MQQKLEESLDRLYRGQTNVAKQAKALGMSLAELSKALTNYIKAHPIDIDAWRDDLDPSWPWH
jgi:transcriptional regulator with AAA-type ATPase domain